ncbi:SusC/RagA family TonB-linked outer membrane protein [Flavobacterium flavigenum]|uniref:SusC/RagA family TonB-linked outer membrane protein n=1 Tax=Flavobacterium flavigenum TaxID=3003258 RepID=UPI002482A940|nr:TonB-dependent receptor [Flavobacterium flavigenum]
MSTLIVLFLTISGYAQEITVTGVVRDKMGSIPGATIIVKNEKANTTSDFDGKFSIKVTNPKTAVLVVKFIGLEDITVPLNGRTSGINIEMKESTSELNEVVVIGYGTQKRGNLTGAVSSIKGTALEKVPTSSVAEALVGKLPGVQITSADGSPGSEIMIRIRGGGSITQDNSPLILVDGFEVATLNDIPPTDIESVEVLKDAASTAIYGARGANGVILVTTKTPKVGKVSVNINSYMQIKTLANRLDVMDPYEYVIMQYEYEKGKTSNPTAFYNRYGQANEMYIYKGDKGTDWQDEIFGSNPITKYLDFSMNGGNEKTKFKFAITNQDQPGVLIGTGLKQTNMNLTLNTKLSDKFTFEFQSRFINQTIEGSGTEGVSLLSAIRQAPTLGLQDYMTLPEDDTYFDPEDYEPVKRFNPIQEAERNYRNRTKRTFNTVGALSWNIMKGLSLRSSFGFEYQYEEDGRFWGLETGTANANGGLPVVGWQMTQSPRTQLNNVLSYNFKINTLHDFQVMVGQEMKDQRSFSKTYTTRYFPESISAEKALDNLALGTPFQNSSKEGSPNKISSFFGRVNYGFDDRYLATFTIRADGSTKFGPDNRWGIFPAAAFAWRMSNEKFLKESTTISNLKLRLSYGVSGNDRIDGDLYAKYYGVSQDKSVGWGEESHYYYNFYNPNGKVTYLNNPNVKWETTYTANFGVDFGFFKERITGNIDIYQNTVKDLLVPSDIPGSSGFSKIMTNVGQTSNKGIEFAINANVVQQKDFHLDVNFNIGYNKNKIDALSTGENEWILSSGWAGTQLLNDDDYRAYVGGTKGLIYGFVNDGFYTMDDFDSFDPLTKTWKLKEGVANSKNLSGDPRPGNAKFKKLTPVDPSDSNTYVIGANDRKVIGDTNPKYSGGFGLNAVWKNFDLSTFFNFVYGFDVFNANKVMMTSWYQNVQNNLGMEVSLENRWRNFDDMGNDLRYSPALLADFNKDATMWNPTSIGRPIASSYAVEKGSFLRLNTLSLGYTIPLNVTQKLTFNKVRLYVTGTNLFVWTNYSGYDPEVNLSTGLTPNVDYNAYPRTRNYTLGAQLSF